MKVYLAARYSRRRELAGYAEELADLGIEVTSRWLTGQHETPPEGVPIDSPEHLAWCADDDLTDIGIADVLVAFTEPEGSVAGRGRGGRHFEMGYAAASEKHVLIVGHRENVFCHLPLFGFAPDWEGAKRILVGARDHGFAAAVAEAP